jgi:signal transduction histidine kinase
MLTWLRRPRPRRECPAWLVRTVTATAAIAATLRLSISLAAWSGLRDSWYRIGIDVGVLTLVLVGTVLCWIRPRYRLAFVVVVWTAVVPVFYLAMWADATKHWFIAKPLGSLLNRLIIARTWPLTICWPSGRFGRTGRRFFIGVLLASGVLWVLSDPVRGLLEHYHWTSATLLARTLSRSLDGLFNWSIAAGAAVCVVHVVRRHRSLPPALRGRERVNLAARLQLLVFRAVYIPIYFVASGLLFDEVGGNTKLGDLLNLVEIGAPILLSVALLINLVGRRRDDELTVDIALTKSDVDLRQLLADALGDSDLEIRPPTLGAPSSATHRVELDGQVVAEILTGRATVPARVVDAAVLTAAAELRHRSLAVRADTEFERLSVLRREIVAAGDEARFRLERNLHDGAQQQLLGLTLLAQQTESLAELTSRITAARADLQRLTDGLGPALVADSGLREALLTVASSAPINVETSLDGLDDLSPGLRDAVWFVVNEALANVYRHSGADLARVVTEQGDGALLVSVSDNGGGAGVGRAGGGLVGLSQRVGALGGSLTFEHSTAGSRLSARVPV